MSEHNHPSDWKKVETQKLRVQVKRNATFDISARPSKLIRKELLTFSENMLQQQDLKNISLAAYRERRRSFPRLPKNRDDIHKYLMEAELKTSKEENFVQVNDAVTGIIIFTTQSNLECLCRQITDIFIDGTFKSCLKFFE